MHDSASARQSVSKPRTLPNRSSKPIPSAPVDIKRSTDGNAWSTVRAHFLHPDRNRYKAHSPRNDVPEGSASPPTCICSPTKHQGSFRCRLHRDTQKRWPNAAGAGTSPAKAFLEDEISVEIRKPSSPGSRVPQAHAVTSVPAVSENATTPNLSASGTGSSEPTTRGVVSIPNSTRPSEPSAASLQDSKDG